MTKVDELRHEIAALVREYHQVAFPDKPFVPGESAVRCAGRVFDAEEMVAIVEAGLDFWLTSGRFVQTFEHQFARFMGVRHVLLVNSGSSANLVALTSLTS